MLSKKLSPLLPRVDMKLNVPSGVSDAVLPMVGLLWLFTFRVVSPTVGVAVAGAVVLVALDVVAWRIVSPLFDRERLLTRYGRA